MDLIRLYQLNLPKEIINIILEYIGYHKYRNGKYIKQLNKNSPIYKSLFNMELIKDGMVELFVKYVKRKSYYEHKIKIFYSIEFNCHIIKEALDDLDYDNSEHEIFVYNYYVY